MDDFVIIAFGFISVMLVASVSLNVIIHRSFSRLSKSFEKFLGINGERGLQLSEVVCVDVPSFHSLNLINSTLNSEDVLVEAEQRRHSISSSSGASSYRSSSPLLLPNPTSSTHYYNDNSPSSDRPISSSRVDVIRYTDLEHGSDTDSVMERPLSVLLEAASRSFNSSYIEHDDYLEPVCQCRNDYLLPLSQR